MGCLSEEQQSSLSNICGNCLDQCRCTCESIKATSYRLKWNWFFVIALSLLVSNGASSQMGTLHEFVTNPTYSGVSGQEFEPGLGESEVFYSWVISINNIGGFLGGIAGMLCTTILPYWFSFMISLACHTFGFLLYAIVSHGWMLIVGRLLVGIFSGLHRSLTFAYFAVTYEYYISENRESKKYCRIKDLLFALYTVSTSLGFLIGAGVSVVFSRFNHIDHFRVIGWYNAALGFAFFVLLVFTFHGEFSRNGRHISCMNLKLIRNTGSKCCNKSSIIVLLIVTFQIVCTAVIKSRVTIYEELFNPILSDAFGFSEDYTVYFFLIILVAPILGGIYLFLIQWTRVNNIIVSIFGIVATIMALLIMSDWQATLHDTCLDFSLYHNPHFGSTDASHVMPPTQHCWSTKNLSGAQPDYHITGMDHGHLELAFKLNNNQEFQRRLVCDVFQSGIGCNACEANKTFKADLSVDRDSQDFCLERSATIAKHDHEMKELIIKCHAKSNESCDIVCLYLYNSNNLQAGANLQEFEYKSPTIKNVYKSLVEDVYIQSLTVVDNNKYTAAMEQCEAHTEEQCHWIPNSIITKQHCGDCEPICRSLRHSLNFIQFSIGAFWFMFSMPVAEVSLPLVISDSVREQFQGIVMGITVASSELLQGITPLWLNVAYEVSGKRTFLPNIILIATFLPFLFGLCALYRTLIRLHKSIHPDNNSKTS